MEGEAGFTPMNCAVALSVGAASAILNFYGMRWLARIAQHLWKNSSERAQERWARLLYVVVVLWIPIATLLAAHIVSLLVIQREVVS